MQYIFIRQLSYVIRCWLEKRVGTRGRDSSEHREPRASSSMDIKFPLSSLPPFGQPRKPLRQSEIPPGFYGREAIVCEHCVDFFRAPDHFQRLDELLTQRGLSLRLLRWTARNLHNLQIDDSDHLAQSFGRVSDAFGRRLFDFFCRGKHQRSIVLRCGGREVALSLPQIVCMKWCVESGFAGFVMSHQAAIRAAYKKTRERVRGKIPQKTEARD